MAFTPGYYQTNYRALRFRELARMHGFRRALARWLETRFKRPTPAAWMPSLWADTECRPEDLSEQFWQVAKMHRANFQRLGYVECGYQKVTKTLNPNVRGSGGICYLDPTRRFFARLSYHRLRSRATGADIHKIIIVFTAAFPQGSVSCTNNRLAFDPVPEREVIRVKSYDVNFIHQEFLKQVQQRKESPREFPDLASLHQWFDARQIAAFEDRTRRRLFISMTEPEVAAARAKMADAAAGVFPKPRPKLRLGWWPVVILAAIGLQYLYPHTGRRPDDTIEYQGQHFKMRRAYASYEDYKDDPDNLNTNELDRIEQAMTSAKIPSNYKDWPAFVHVLIFDLAFPGYGEGFIGDPPRTDDGSKLIVESVEIPQRDKDRYFVLRQVNGGELNLVDDFVFGTATNFIHQVRLENQTLHYYDSHGLLLREKNL